MNNLKYSSGNGSYFISNYFIFKLIFNDLLPDLF